VGSWFMSGEAKMMGKLEEKTKKWGCYHCSCCRFYHGLAKGCELPRCAYILVSVAQQEIDDCRTEATKELLNLAIHGLKEAQNGESSDCVSTFATIIEKLGIHVEYDEWHEPIIDVEQVKTVLEGNEKEKAKP